MLGNHETSIFYLFSRSIPKRGFRLHQQKTNSLVCAIYNLKLTSRVANEQTDGTSVQQLDGTNVEQTNCIEQTDGIGGNVELGGSSSSPTSNNVEEYVSYGEEFDVYDGG